MPSESSISKEQANPNAINDTAIILYFTATIAPADAISSRNVKRNPTPNTAIIQTRSTSVDAQPKKYSSFPKK